MKKFVLLLALCSFLFANAGIASAKPYVGACYKSIAFLVDDKPAYDKAYFNGISFWFWDERAESESDKTQTGSLTIKNGTYSFLDADGKLVDVKNEDRTFDLKCNDYYNNGVEFAPKIGDKTLRFRKLAETGLPGRRFSWSALGYSGSGAIYNFNTTEQQLAKFVPYVEITPTGVEFRMVSASDTSKPLKAPYSGYYKVSVSDIKEKRLAGTKWNRFNINGALTERIPLDASDLRKISGLEVRLLPSVGDDYAQYTYDWNFRRTSATNEGVSNEKDLLPVKLKVGEEAKLNVTLKPDYWGIDDLDAVVSPLIIGDKSLVDADWTYDKDSRTYKLTIKGLKSGTTGLSVYYQKKYDESVTLDYRTAPIQITVE